MTDIFIIGAAKSGTTVLYEWLSRHNRVFMPAVKEPHYFAFRGQSAKTIGKGVDPDYANQMAFDQESYDTLFADAGPGQLTGDASPGYLYYPHVASAIHRHNPNALIICVLRNPVDRAFSQYMHHRRDGFEPLQSFEAALEVEAGRIKRGYWWGYHYRSASLYAQSIARYFEFFPRYRILLLQYEELKANPLDTYGQVTDFIGVGRTPETVDFARQVNVSSGLRTVPRMGRLHRFSGPGSKLRSGIERHLPPIVEETARATIDHWNRIPSPRLTQATRDRLLELHKPDIEQLSEVSGHDFSGWLAGSDPVRETRCEKSLAMT